MHTLKECDDAIEIIKNKMKLANNNLMTFLGEQKLREIEKIKSTIVNMDTMKINIEFKANTTDADGFNTLVTIGRLLKRQETDADVIRELLKKHVYNVGIVTNAIIASVNEPVITVDCQEWSYVAGFTLTK